MQPMARTLSRPQKTIDDYLALPDGVRGELIGGEIYVTPAPTPRHSDIGYTLGGLLGAWARETGWGRRFGAPCDVLLPSGDVVQPDLFLVAKANRRVVRSMRVEGVPDLVVEILSTTHVERDRIVKYERYARNEVPEYWIVDPVAGTIEVFRLEGRTYRAAGYFARGSVLTSESLPGFRLSLGTLFA